MASKRNLSNLTKGIGNPGRSHVGDAKNGVVKIVMTYQEQKGKYGSMGRRNYKVQVV